MIDSSSSPAPQVQAGDLLVSVNGLSLIGTPPLTTNDGHKDSMTGGGFGFDAAVKAISQVTLHF